MRAKEQRTTMNDTVLESSYEKIDTYLEALTGRHMVSTNEVQDLLLDLRLDLDRLRDQGGVRAQPVRT